MTFELHQILSRTFISLVIVIAVFLLIDLFTVGQNATNLIVHMSSRENMVFGSVSLLSVENGTDTITFDAKDIQDLWSGDLSNRSYHPYWLYEPEYLVEKGEPLLDSKSPSILYTVGTTVRNHRRRLDVLLRTWLTTVAAGDVHLVTDGYDREYQNKASIGGARYVVVDCHHNLCCKMGEEIRLMYRKESSPYNWWCHVNDDMYINHRELVKLLSRFDPDVDAVYLGRSQYEWDNPGNLTAEQLVYPDTERGRRYHHALEPLVCLSRPMLDRVRPWLGGGERMRDTCGKFADARAAVVGATVELVAGGRLCRTELYSTHYQILSEAASPDQLAKQIAYSHGCGRSCDGVVNLTPRNTVNVPDPKFFVDEDPTRFLSVHCFLYPNATLCA